MIRDLEINREVTCFEMTPGRYDKKLNFDVVKKLVTPEKRKNKNFNLNARQNGT